jgi:hypothetical protein
MESTRNWFISTAFLAVSLPLAVNNSYAERITGPPTQVIERAYQQILAGADKNKDGKLSKEECLAISRDKKKVEKDCTYWDANGDGFITKDEYVQQVRKLMK